MGRLLCVLYVLVVYSLGRRVAGHPLCFYGDRPTDPEAVLIFCPEQTEGACCTPEEEMAAIEVYNAASPVGLTGDCAEYYRQVACGPCNSYSAHLYERLGKGRGPEDGMTMKREFCNELVTACEGQIDFPTYDGESYCDKHVGGKNDKLWSYPIDPQEMTFESTGLLDAFPDLPDDDLPSELIAMHMTPDDEWWFLAGQGGEIVKIIPDGPTNSTLVLDMSSGMQLRLAYEEGLMDFAFDPAYKKNKYFYVSYTVEDNEGRKNRLTRFTHLSTPKATKASMSIVLTSEPKVTPIHSAGWCGFKPSDYRNPSGTHHDIYWAHGDGGPQEDPYGQGQNTTNLMASIVRVSVPSGTGKNDVGYIIPAGNIKSGRPEICAYGLRNPFRCGFDSDTDDLYCADVGHIRVEEIDLIECGKNYGWGRFEGSRCQESREDIYGECDGVDRSGYTFPVFEYCHPDYASSDDGEQEFTAGVDICGSRSVRGTAIIGGSVYRGQRFIDVLDGAILFADAQLKNIYYLKDSGAAWEAATIISDGTAAIISFAIDNSGEHYVIAADRKPYQLPCGDLCSTTCLDQSAVEPTYKSLGCFSDVVEDRALQLKEAPSCPEGRDAMSPQICASYCDTVKGARYFGVQFAYGCYCGAEGEEYDVYGSLPMASCGTLCTGNPEQTCGGFLAMEVFSFESGTPAPVPDTPITLSPIPLTPQYTYLGCYGDENRSRVFTGPSKFSIAMTTQLCASYCEGSQYFGTEFGTECYCSAEGDEYDEYGTRDTCDTECDGNASEICGGLRSISVYKYDADSPTSATSSPTASPAETASPTASEVETSSPTASPVKTASPTASEVETASPTALEVETASPTASPVETASPTASDVETSSPTVSPVETASPTASDMETSSPTSSPVQTESPTASPVETASPTAAEVETASPTASPVQTPSPTPSPVKTESPTASPVETASPTAAEVETASPTASPVQTPPPTPSPVKTESPTASPVETASPTAAEVETPPPMPSPTAPLTPSPTDLVTMAPIADPNYLGCYEDSLHNRIMPVRIVDASMTNEECSLICAGYMYYGTQYGTQCYCSNSDSFAAIGESSGCTTSCSGDPTQVCGGDYAMSVYWLADSPTILEETPLPTPSPTVPPATLSPTPAPTKPVPTFPPVTDPDYLGCYADNVHARIMPSRTTSTNMTNQVCAGVCSGYEYYGTQDGDECYCSNSDSYASRGESSGCNTPCAGDPTQACGGVFAMSVYLLGSVETQPPTPSPTSPPTPAPTSSRTPSPSSPLTPPPTPSPTESSMLVGLVDDPNYVGCYADSLDDRVMSVGGVSPTMTNEECASICSGFTYYGTEYGNECYCSNTDSFTGIGESTGCTMGCAGDPAQACGGIFAVSVYEADEPDLPAADTPSPVPSPPTPSAVEPLPLVINMDPNYVGCYEDIPGSRMMGARTTSDEMTSELCASRCLGYEFYGLQYGDECWCGGTDSFTAQEESTSCTMRCTGDSKRACGGYDAMAVYRSVEIPPPASSDYRGCYQDSPDKRVMTSLTESPDMTNEMCAGTCAGYKFYGTQFGVECWCSDTDSYASLGESNSCGMRCAGDSSQACGGFLALSVYENDGEAPPPAPETPASYVGCFEDDRTERIMTTFFSTPDMTNEVCASLCTGYTYYGTEYGIECWCSDTDGFRSLGESDSCSMPCAGDATQTCGGDYAMDVYEP